LPPEQITKSYTAAPFFPSAATWASDVPGERQPLMKTIALGKGIPPFVSRVVARTLAESYDLPSLLSHLFTKDSA